jgi:hypothetical protein
MATHYNARFYDDQADGSLRSAREIVPTILDLTGARSVVDVGCGVGTWLKSYSELGVTECLGMDGSWVTPARLLIDPSNFRSVDLLAPPQIGRRFDLAQSLEVAEHLPDSHAEKFVEFLTGLADVVLFSAAIPNQGGTNHINERWPGYWRALFARRDFAVYDTLRPRFWSSEAIEWWYAQNLFLYVKRGARPDLVARLGVTEGWSYPECVVHPARIDPTRNAPPGLRGLLGAMPFALAGAARRMRRNILRS